MEEGYSICFNEWIFDKTIKNELGLLLIISSLSAENGYCYASNDYLSNLFKVEKETISRKLKKLEDKNYITIEYEKKGCEIVFRKIRLTKISIHDCLKNQSTIDEKVKENNISNNNISNKEKENIKRKKITIEEIEEYIKEKNLNVDAKTFYDYFNENNWIDSKGNKVKSWKQKLITWNSYSKKEIKAPDWLNKKIEIKENKINKEDEEWMKENEFI